MYIEKITIGNFGKLSNMTLELSSGVNIIEGGNESGKTTLGEFIKFIFYGLSNKTTDSHISERERHISWSSNEVSGSLILNCGSNKYRIERMLTPHGKTYREACKIIDLSSNTPLDISEEPGQHFFGVPESIFTHTAYVRQTDGASFNGESIGQAVENILYSADESVNTQKALKKLDEARVLLKHKKNTGGGILNELAAERAVLRERLNEARESNQSILLKEAQLRDTESNIEKNKRQSEQTNRLIKCYNAFFILKRFDGIKEHTKQIEEYDRLKKELYENGSYNGFFPDGEYVKRLNAVKSELAVIENNYMSLKNGEGDNAFIEPSPELSDKTLELFEKAKNRDSIRDDIAVCRSKKKTFGLLCAMFAFFAVVCGLLAFVLAKLSFGFPFYLGTSLFAVGAIICFVFSSRRASEIKNILSEFSVSSEEELEKLFDGLNEYEEKINMRRESATALQRQTESLKAMYTQKQKEASELLGIWGHTSDKVNLKEQLGSAINDAEELIETVTKLDIEKDKQMSQKNLLESQLGSYDEEELRALLNEEVVSKIESVDINSLNRSHDFTTKALESLEARKNELEKELERLRATSEDPALLGSRINEIKQRQRELQTKHDAYVMAYEKLCEASISLRNQLSPRLSETAGELMAYLTDGKYGEIGVSGKLGMTYVADGFTRDIENVSSGTQDLAYVSLRLALVRLLCGEKGVFPVIFDEAFARVDDRRLENMLKTAERFSGDASQTLIFTSQKREAVIMKNCGKYSHIVLE